MSVVIHTKYLQFYVVQNNDFYVTESVTPIKGPQSSLGHPLLPNVDPSNYYVCGDVRSYRDRSETMNAKGIIDWFWESSVYTL